MNKKQKSKTLRIKKGISLIVLFIVFCSSLFMVGYTTRRNAYEKGYSDYTQAILYNENSDIPSSCYTDVQIPNIFARSNHSSKFITNDREGKRITLDYGSLNLTLYVSSVLPTGSMRPAISDNATIILAEVKSERDINIGDVISIEINKSNSNQPRLLHRVINIIHEEKGNITYYVTKGDNNERNDEEAFGIKVTIDMIRGKVVGIIY